MGIKEHWDALRDPLNTWTEAEGYQVRDWEDQFGPRDRSILDGKCPLCNMELGDDWGIEPLGTAWMHSWCMDSATIEQIQAATTKDISLTSPLFDFGSLEFGSQLIVQAVD